MKFNILLSVIFFGLLHKFQNETGHGTLFVQHEARCILKLVQNPKEKKRQKYLEIYEDVTSFPEV